MLLCTVGMDPTNGVPRFIDYSNTNLLNGFEFIPTLIGLFAIAEVIAGVERIINGEETQAHNNEKITNVLPDGKTIRQIWPNILSGGIIGALIMTFLSPLVAKVAMKFTSAEMLMLAFFGLSVIVSISGKSIANRALKNTTTAVTRKETNTFARSLLGNLLK